MTTRSNPVTDIFKFTQSGEYHIGQIQDNIIYALPQLIECGRVDQGNRIIRKAAHGEQDLGYATEDGQIIGNGLFEGGPIGWVEDDGAVVRAGLILGEEDVGRVNGPQKLAAAAALLLYFLPQDAEDAKQMMRRG